MKFFKFLAVIFSAIILVSCAATRADKNTMAWRYEIEPVVGQATQGSILVKVWSYSPNRNVARNQAAKNAIHGILFKGVSALNDANARIPAQKPMVTEMDAESKYSKYFNEFFDDGGKYMKFVNFINNGIPEAGDMIKIKNEYKVGIVVSVAKDALRKELESHGIIKSLTSGF